MFHGPLLEILTDVLVLSYAIPIGLFIGLYATRSPWAETELGVALMFQKISFLGLYVLLALGLLLGSDYWGRDILRAVVYGAIGFFLWLDVVNLLRYQRGIPRLGKTKQPRGNLLHKLFAPK